MQPIRPRIQLLGDFSITFDDAEIPIKLGTARYLVAYLAIESDRSHSREKLSELLWPGHSPDNALMNLRQTLYHLRRDLGACPPPPFVETGRKELRLDPERVRIDAVDFQHHLAEHRWDEALHQYRGDLLDTFTPRGNAFHDWLHVARQHLREGMLSALDALIEKAEAGGDTNRAIELSQQRLKAEPWDERTHRRLMRLYLANGHRDAALRQYRTCAQWLEQDLGVGPDTETEALATAIRRGDAAPVRDEQHAAHRLGPLQQRKLAHLFRLTDRDGDGLIGETDFREHVERFGKARGLVVGSEGHRLVRDSHMGWWHAMAPLAGAGGRLDIDGWYHFWADWFQAVVEEAARNYSTVLEILKGSAGVFFDALDGDGDGFIGLADYACWLSTWDVSAPPDDAFRLLDENNEGRLDRETLIRRTKEFFFSNDPESAGNTLYGAYTPSL